MALQSSGPISLTQIQTEFGGSDPISLTEYYRGGAYTTDNNTGVPTSGAISMAGDFYGTVRAVAMTYEIIGGGGEGGGGYLGGTGASGTASSFSASGISTVTSSGGVGRGGSGSTGQAGDASFYGPGGAGGINSDSNRQTPGYAAPATSYGAGGGGGGAYPFAANNGGAGGGAATRQANTVNIVPGVTVSVTIGSGGAAITGGGNGAGGYAKFVVGGQTFEYTTAGSHSFTVPS